MITARYENQIYAVLRMVAGFLFFWHGLDKIFLVFATHSNEAPFIRFTAGIIELIGGPLIMFGLYTRYAAFLSSGLMAAAFWIANAPDSILPYLSRGDLTVLYCFVFLYLSAKGSGMWSVDAWLEKRRLNNS